MTNILSNSSQFPKMFHYLVVGFGLIIFTSCANYSLSSEELKWNPYNVGDELVFVDNKGAMMNLKITSLDRNVSKINPYAGNFSGKYEQLIVNYLFINGPDRELHTLLAIGKDPKGRGFFNPTLEIPRIIHQSNPFSFDELQRKAKTQLTVRGKTYYDVLIFNPTTPTETLAIPHITKLYWSISKGCVKFVLSNNTIWELQS